MIPTAKLREKDHVLGPPHAPVTLVEYGDYECPYCGRAYPAIGELKERMGDRLRLVFRHYPLDSVHPRARRLAEAAEAAAAQGSFWPMHDLLYENQDALTDDDLERYAASLGLDIARFGEDLAGHRQAERVQEDRLEGKRDGVRGTPALFFNGEPYEGPVDVGSLLAAAEEAVTTEDMTGGSPVAVRRWDGSSNRATGPYSDPIGEICSEKRGVDNVTLRRVVELAVEIAREGREGRKIGTLFVVGDSEAVLAHSRPMILDPLAGHPEERKRIGDPNVRETLKELAQLDGAFVVSDGGVVLSAARYIDAVSDSLALPLGLGSRHMAAASVSKTTEAVAVAVSESSTVRVFDDGDLVAEVVPEVWLLRGYGPYPDAPVRERTRDDHPTATEAR